MESKGIDPWFYERKKEYDRTHYKEMSPRRQKDLKKKREKFLAERDVEGRTVHESKDTKHFDPFDGKTMAEQMKVERFQKMERKVVKLDRNEFS